MVERRIISPEHEELIQEQERKQKVLVNRGIAGDDTSSRSP
jgi:hypothetical protein